MNVLKSLSIAVLLTGWFVPLILGVEVLFEYRLLDDNNLLQLESYPWLESSRKLIRIALVWLFVASCAAVFFKIFIGPGGDR